MQITNSDLIAMHYKQILGRAFIWLKDPAYITQLDCSLKFIYFLSLLEIVLSLEQQACLFSLFLLPIYLK